jgi:chemotaxis protein methyltransferase CheR
MTHLTNKEISDEEFRVVRDFLESRCGILLGDNKKYLVQTRLERLLKEANSSSYIELINSAQKNLASGLMEKIIDKMTTNETLWFRDGYPFSILEGLILPALLNKEKKTGRLRIWSSAAATGQESYSIAMTISEFCRKNPSTIDNHRLTIDNFEILGTDISPTVLETARKGQYDSFDISRGLPENYLHKYFEKKGDLWEAGQEIKRMVKFRTFNLQMPFSEHGKFDVIFCRNVMIYFSQDFKKELMEKFKESLNDRGYFFLGMSESIFGMTKAFESVVQKGGVVFRKL